MTTFSDETLMAFADDELDPAARAAVGAAMQNDPEIQRRVAQHRALRSRIRLAYSADLAEAPPARLVAAARGAAAVSVSASEGRPVASVSNLADARAANAARAARPPEHPVRWWPVASVAASLLIGVGLGYATLRQRSPIQLDAGGLVARGVLADALSTQLGGDQASRAVARVGLSFIAKSGEYCRVFNLDGSEASTGVACRGPGAWRIQVLAQQPATAVGAAGAAARLRTASSGLPPAILNAVQEQIVGEALDPAGEAQALARGWRAASR